MKLLNNRIEFIFVKKFDFFGTSKVELCSLELINNFIGKLGLCNSLYIEKIIQFQSFTLIKLLCIVLGSETFKHT